VDSGARGQRGRISQATEQLKDAAELKESLIDAAEEIRKLKEQVDKSD